MADNQEKRYWENSAWDNPIVWLVAGLGLGFAWGWSFEMVFRRGY